MRSEGIALVLGGVTTIPLDQAHRSGIVSQHLHHRDQRLPGREVHRCAHEAQAARDRELSVVLGSEVLRGESDDRREAAVEVEVDDLIDRSSFHETGTCCGQAGDVMDTPAGQ